MSAIFLDNASTTKATEEVKQEVARCLTEDFYNPSAEYIESVSISKQISNAREYILNRLGANSGSIIFTSGATESNNLAIRGVVREGNWEYVFSSGEHSSVYNLAKALETEGKIVHFIPLLENGEIDYNSLERVVNEKTRLVSIIYVSNETGAINDIKRISTIVKSKNKRILIHVDGVQAFNKIPFSVDELNVDFLSYSAHKFHGMKGCGGLYVRNVEALKPLVQGGGQEFGKRSGTENVAGILSSVVAMKNIDINKNLKHVKQLHEIFISYFEDKNDVKIVKNSGSPYIISLSFYGVNGETLMRALENEVIVGKGSACSSKSAGNRILEAMGFEHNRVKSSIRVSFDYQTTCEEVKFACQKIYEKYKEIYEKVK